MTSSNQKTLGKLIHRLARILWHGAQRSLPVWFCLCDLGTPKSLGGGQVAAVADKHWVESELGCLGRLGAGQMVGEIAGKKTGGTVVYQLHYIITSLQFSQSE